MAQPTGPNIEALFLGMVFTAAVSCSDDASQTSRFYQAETLSQQWCLDAQLQITSLESSTLGREHIDFEVFTDEKAMTSAKASIDADSEKPIISKALIKTMTNSLEAQAPPSIAKEVFCKFKSQEGIERGLDIEIDGTEGSCRQMHQQALDWALSNLSHAERQRYLSDGTQLALADDILGATGADWYATDSQYAPSDSSYSLSAAALLVPFDDYPGLPLDLRGVHYCKLLPPSQMLFWVLHRAFFDNPLGAGPNNDADAALVAQAVADCRLHDISAKGSCIFFFATSGQHFCEEYTGPDWDEQSAQQRCAERDDPVFSTSLCADRASETLLLDDDGQFKGECVINCGKQNEYRWKVYSEPPGMELEAACGVSWFAAP